MELRQRRAVHGERDDSVLEDLLDLEAAMKRRHLFGRRVGSERVEVARAGLQPRLLEEIAHAHARPPRVADGAVFPLHARHDRPIQRATIPGALQDAGRRRLRHPSKIRKREGQRADRPRRPRSSVQVAGSGNVGIPVVAHEEEVVRRDVGSPGPREAFPRRSDSRSSGEAGGGARRRQDPPDRRQPAAATRNPRRLIPARSVFESARRMRSVYNPRPFLIGSRARNATRRLHEHPRQDPRLDEPRARRRRHQLPRRRRHRRHRDGRPAGQHLHLRA